MSKYIILTLTCVFIILFISTFIYSEEINKSSYLWFVKLIDEIPLIVDVKNENEILEHTKQLNFPIKNVERESEKLGKNLIHVINSLLIEPTYQKSTISNEIVKVNHRPYFAACLFHYALNSSPISYNEKIYIHKNLINLTKVKNTFVVHQLIFNSINIFEQLSDEISEIIPHFFDERSIDNLYFTSKTHADNINEKWKNSERIMDTCYVFAVKQLSLNLPDFQKKFTEDLKEYENAKFTVRKRMCSDFVDWWTNNSHEVRIVERKERERIILKHKKYENCKTMEIGFF